MNILFAILVLSLFCYAAFVLLTGFTWYSRKEKKTEKRYFPFMSIVIAARNEEKTIQPCLISILQQNYPKENFEIIVIDDCSSDGTSALVEKIILENPGVKISLIILKENSFFKKGALSEGINCATGEIIVTRDADTVSHSSEWLTSIARCFDNINTAMLLCPVVIKGAKGFIENFQLCENYTLQAIGGGSALLGIPFLCNGANLAFNKKAFEAVNGFSDNKKIASGDDIFLLEKFRRKYPAGVKYCTQEESIIYTQPEKDLHSVLHQKSRWASKFFRTVNPINFFLGISVFTINFLFLLLAALSCIFGGWYKYLILTLCIKWIIDFLLLILASARFKNWNWLMWFIPLEIMNIFYSAVIPLAALFIKPQWKGRKI